MPLLFPPGGCLYCCCYCCWYSCCCCSFFLSSCDMSCAAATLARWLDVWNWLPVVPSPKLKLLWPGAFCPLATAGFFSSSSVAKGL